MQSSWIATNWPAVASAVVLIITNIGLLANALRAVNQHEKKLELLEMKMEAHHQSMTLHRTPDFEKRLDEFSGLLRDIKRDVELLIHQKE